MVYTPTRSPTDALYFDDVTVVTDLQHAHVEIKYAPTHPTTGAPLHQTYSVTLTPSAVERLRDALDAFLHDLRPFQEYEARMEDASGGQEDVTS